MDKAMAAAIFAAAAVVAGCSVGRGETAGATTSRDYAVGAFERLEVAGPYEVAVTTGGAPSVTVTGNERAIERMVVEVENGTLRIHHGNKRMFNIGWGKRDPIRVAVTVPMLSGAAIAGSGGISIDKVSGDRFEGEIAGSGGLNLAAVAVKDLRIDVAGSGEVKAVGRAAGARYDIAGSGDIDAAGLVAERADVSIAGAGNVRAHATRTAAVEIAGAGDVEMTGGAKCTVNKMGAGNVRCS